MNTRPLLALAAISLVPAAVIAIDSGVLGDFSVSNSFAPGTPARASEVNQNFTDVTNALLALDGRLAEVPTPANVVQVATSGAPFTSIASALASITDASDTNPYVVRIAPGVYDEVQRADVPPFVRVQGAGAGVTILRTNITANSNTNLAAAMGLGEDALVSDMTIRNTGSSAISSGIFVAGAGTSTIIEDVEVIVDGSGGTGHIALVNADGDVRVRRSRLRAAGANIVNTAFGSMDTAAAFSQPLITESELLGEGVNSGIGMQLSNTAAEIRECRIDGQFRGVLASVNGISRIHNSEVRTLGLNPVYEQTGSASILSASVGFIGGNPLGLASRFRYVHCYKANFQPIVNGDGSTVQ